ncbi:MAG TPA: butanol dehydrogenase [Polaromonas sp.]|jgi:cytochrome c-type protein NapC|uniref:NapC/NirT family cytochrome c n=1 Tax=Polaromonas sp. UBA4122 TaxID=1947074 RepID=UPI000EC89088|nr:NapC/NirT family cytochrome c [Polaromonas sp. UBA4122]HAL36617.1 butanol dehydrogenase [Polaromonas sp.]
MPYRSLARLRKWSTGKKTFVVLLAGFAISIVVLILTATTLVYTSTEAFCSSSCHEMNNNAMEYKGTVHDKNRTGVRATCPDCHIPHSPVPLYIRKMGAVHDLWGHFVSHSIDTREKFLDKRQELAERVWIYMKENDSRECRHCHTAAKMDPERQSEKAQLRHARGRKEKLTCIDCHFAIAHDEPAGPGPQELEVDKSLISKGAIF